MSKWVKPVVTFVQPNVATAEDSLLLVRKLCTCSCQSGLDISMVCMESPTEERIYMGFSQGDFIQQDLTNTPFKGDWGMPPYTHAHR